MSLIGRQSIKGTMPTVEKHKLGSWQCRDIDGKRMQWTETHSWYLLMGGFVYDTDDEDFEYIEESPQLVLNEAGLIFLLGAGMDFLPRTSDSDIMLLSPNDPMMKVLVVCQAAYLLFQIVARWTFGHEVSLLETHTAAHIIISILIYWCWFDKPQDVKQQMFMKDEWTVGAAALLYMKNAPSRRADEEVCSELAHYLPGLLVPSTREQGHQRSCWRDASAENAWLWDFC